MATFYSSQTGRKTEVSTTTPEGLLAWIRHTLQDRYGYNATARFTPCYMTNGWLYDADGNPISEKPRTHYLENRRHRIEISAEAYAALHAAWNKDRYGRFAANSARGLKFILNTLLALPGYREINDRLAHEEAARERRQQIGSCAAGLDDAAEKLQRMVEHYAKFMDHPERMADAIAIIAGLKNEALSKQPAGEQHGP